jgi:hypothetical protein
MLARLASREWHRVFLLLALWRHAEPQEGKQRVTQSGHGRAASIAFHFKYST